MNQKKTRWAILGLAACIALLFVLPPRPEAKTRPQRIQSVNHLASASSRLPATNALPTAIPKR